MVVIISAQKIRTTINERVHSMDLIFGKKKLKREHYCCKDGLDGVKKYSGEENKWWREGLQPQENEWEQNISRQDIIISHPSHVIASSVSGPGNDVQTSSCSSQASDCYSFNLFSGNEFSDREVKGKSKRGWRTRDEEIREKRWKSKGRGASGFFLWFQFPSHSCLSFLSASSKRCSRYDLNVFQVHVGYFVSFPHLLISSSHSVSPTLSLIPCICM